jgi:hypothetical protein
MKLTDIKKNLKRSHLLLRIWLWAAMRSPNFQDCQLYLQSPLIRVELQKNTCSYGYLLFRITINRPMLVLNTSWEICQAFAITRKQAGETIDLDPVDDTPF